LADKSRETEVGTQMHGVERDLLLLRDE
jgi:hypothetical protein